ncbi:MAG: hypothetical protein F6K39_15535 [Okeania sp. SIO3B3]|nr:hypothetical protein [Okeania sp. SIO3B3]
MKLNPNNAEIHSNFGLTLKDNQKLEAVIEHSQKRNLKLAKKICHRI